MQMSDRMTRVAEGKVDDSKMLLYSGHDTTILPVLASLIGDRMDRWPVYCANVVCTFEPQP